MIYINRDTELTAELLQKMISKFTLNTLPKLKKWDKYYRGKHAILNKTYADPSKECNHIVTNFCKIIVDTYAGYIVGKPVTYTSNQNIEDVQEVINYNDSESEDMNWLTNALIYGVGYELKWMDKFAQVRYTQVNPMNGFAVYDNTLDCELLAFIRWYEVDAFDDSDIFYVEVSDAVNVTTYKMRGMNGSLEFISQEPHYFGDVPVSVFYLNDYEDNIFDCIISLNDAYNELQSSEIDDFGAWVDAYLLLVGADLDSEDVAAMKTNRVLVLPEGASADWLVKNASDTQVENMLDNIKKNIYKVTNCPDMGDDNFMAQSGVAIKYKLVGFENIAAGIVTRFTKAIQRRVELICNVLNLKASEAMWRDININFVRNLPVDYTEIVQLINSLKGTVSDATLLSQLPFITDVDAELEAVQAQREASVSLYNFGPFEDEDSDVNE